jgi:hypothetical protein
VDLRAIESTITIARLAGKPACVVLNQSPARCSLAQEAAEAVKDLSVALAPTEIIRRVAFIHAFTTAWAFRSTSLMARPRRRSKPFLPTSKPH